MDIFGVFLPGIVAGWLASRLMDSGIYRIAGNMVAGILGAYGSSRLAVHLLGIDATGPSLPGVAVALVGAFAVIVIFSAVGPGRQTLGQIILGR